MVAASSGSVSLIATDTGSGVDVTYFTLDGGDLVIGTEVLAASEGTHTVQFWSADAARNVEATNTAVFTVDRAAPITTTDALASYAGTATITLSATDGADGSGVSATWFRLDGAQEAAGSVVTTTTVGEHALEYWSVDNAGNVEQSQTATFSVAVPGEVSLLDSPPDVQPFSAAPPDSPLLAPALFGRRPTGVFEFAPSTEFRLSA